MTHQTRSRQPLRPFDGTSRRPRFSGKACLCS